MDYTKDPNFWTRNHNVEVEVMSWGSFQDVVPVADELTAHFGDVRSRVVFPRPETGATSGPDWEFIIQLAVTVTAVGGAEFARKVIGSIADDAYSSLRGRLLAYRTRSSDMATLKNGLVIWIGTHGFAFDQSIDDAEFRRQLRAAQLLVDHSPVELLARSSDVDWQPWLWDAKRQQWRTSSARLARAVGEEPVDRNTHE